MRKKITALVLLMALALTACQKDRAGTQQEQKQEASEPEISIVVNTEHTEDTQGDEKMIAEVLAGMTLEQKVSQLVMPAIRTWGTDENAVPVTELNDALKDAIKTYQFGGIILFAQNTADAAQTAQLTTAIQEANAAGDATCALFIGVDQEGGMVARIGDGTQMPGNMALGATGDPSYARKAAGIIGEELSCMGLNVDFAPVLDVNSNPSNPVIGIRSFSDDPKVVAAFGKEYLAGLHEQKVIGAIKHFPGHGDTDTDSHSGLPSIDKSHEELRKLEWIPYQECLGDADMVMTAHIEFPQIEQETSVSKETGEEIFLPATLSQTMITDILREELGFEGVVVSDALEMKAISEHFDKTDAAKRMILAGVDLQLMPVSMRDEQEIAEMGAYLNSIVEAVRSGEIPQEQIDASVTRILRLKQKYGLLSKEAMGAAVSEGIASVGSRQHHKAEWEIASAAVTMPKCEGHVLPLAAGSETVVLIPDESQTLSVAYAAEKLQRDGILPSAGLIRAVCYAKRNASEAADLIGNAQNVIGIFALRSQKELDPKSEAGAGSAFLDAAILAAHAKGLPFVLISAQLPYDIARFGDADAILACYNAKGMEELPAEGKKNKQYGPNLPAAIYALYSDRMPTGALPVSVPKLADDYSYSDEILYGNGFGIKEQQTDASRVILGDERFDAYIPDLAGKRVALFSNQTGIVGDEILTGGSDSEGEDPSLIPFGQDAQGNPVSYGQHILDALLEHDVQVSLIFSPEHGFRGNADAGATVNDSADIKTGIAIRSLYGSAKTPSAADMERFDTLVVDLQDVGLRYYTYYLTLYDLMEACAKYGKEIVILDRPNPNGFYVDGPILKESFSSGVGKLPIPVVYGLTLGELAGMINGEGWLSSGKNACRLKVIPCKNYTHKTQTSLIKNPSPNLKDMRSIYLYASTCYFENTACSVGRGTAFPFEAYGSPYLKDASADLFSFTPMSMEGAKNPPFLGQTCYGRDLREIPLSQICAGKIDLTYLIEAYRELQRVHPEIDFFGKPDGNGRYWIDLLMGTDSVRKMITDGKSAEEIRDSWADDVASFLEQRKPYLLYE